MKLPIAIQTILFDLDNTLIDRDAAMSKAIQHWLQKQNTVPEKERGTQLDLILKKDQSGHTDTLLFCDWLLHTYGNSHTKNTQSSQEVLKELQENASGHLQPNELLLSVLDSLKQRYQLVIASNGSTFAQSKKIERSHLSRLFSQDHIYISESIGYAKPHPQFFETILAAIQQKPEHCLMVGDHYLNDIEAAKNKGFHTCWITKEKTVAKSAADLIFTKITDIAQWTEL